MSSPDRAPTRDPRPHILFTAHYPAAGLRKLYGSIAAALASLLLACNAPGGDALGDRGLAPVDDQHIHFLIPGAPGGGWDGTARGVGEALRRAGLVEQVSYENLSGGGGGRAMAHLIATAERQKQTWMVSSTPIVLRSLRGRLPQSFRDLEPIAAVIGDYLTFVVRDDSPYHSWLEVLEAYRRDPRSVKIAGGSVRGGMDHLVASLALQAAGEDPAKLRYVAYDTGGKAMIALLSGEVPVLTTGLGEAMEAWRAGQIRILAIAADERVPEAPGVPTLTEIGSPMSFINWRGFFAAPGVEPERIDRHLELLSELFESPEWEEVRQRFGWVEIYKPGDEFSAFLDEQEEAMRKLFAQLGMRTVASEP